jgi:hypothetical protein
MLAMRVSQSYINRPHPYPLEPVQPEPGATGARGHLEPGPTGAWGGPQGFVSVRFASARSVG